MSKTNYPPGWLSGITDCRLIPLWDYEQRWGTAWAGTMAEPENYTYDATEEAQDIKRIENILRAFRE